MSRSWFPDVALVGDAKLVLRQMIDYSTGKVERGDWRRYPRVAEIARLKEEFKRDVELVAGSESPIHPAKLASAVSEVMEHDAIPILGEGINRVWTAKVLEVRTAGHWVSASDYGCRGFSVPAAIGVKLGRPEKQVFCITGDGSFQMQMHEIPVAKQYKAPVTWFIADNGTLGWIKEHQRDQMGGRYIAVDFDPAWRFDKVAEACGIEVMRVERASELMEAVTRAFNLNREGMPVVVDVITPQFPKPLKQSS